MAVARLYPNQPWPEGEDPVWPPVRARLQVEFQTRFDFLEQNLFRDAFLWTRIDKDADNPIRRAEKVKGMSTTLILDRNLPVVCGMVRQSGIFTEDELREVIATAGARALNGELCRRVDNKLVSLSVEELLCEWHDAHTVTDPSPDATAETTVEMRCSRRRRVFRWLVQRAARDHQHSRMLTVDPQTFNPAAPPSRSERDRMLDRLPDAIDAVLLRLPDPTDRLVFELRWRHKLKLHEIKDELAAAGKPLSIKAVWDRYQKVLDALGGELDTTRPDGE